MLKTNGYMAATRSTGMPRDVEYQVFCKVTGAMSRASEDPADFPALAAAMNENLVLWRTIAVDVMDKDNGLSKELRAQLFYLFEFAQSHTPKVLRGEADATALIDINTSIIGGLKQKTVQLGAI